mmetsp:Transcript_15360/g.31167  ORF Transcript_15360/g.31167 Transcript_15360/m.31167 type:complete len:88 (+) Transcript_15360:439-702(+)
MHEFLDFRTGVTVGGCLDDSLIESQTAFSKVGVDRFFSFLKKRKCNEADGDEKGRSKKRRIFDQRKTAGKELTDQKEGKAKDRRRTK